MSEPDTIVLTHAGATRLDNRQGTHSSPSWAAARRRCTMRFDRLDILSQVALVSTLEAAIPRQTEANEASTGLVLTTTRGCHDVDVRFIQSWCRPEGASPMLFSSTLPSTAPAGIAIDLNIGGPVWCMVTDQAPLATAVWESVSMIAEADAERCVCVFADAVTPETTKFLPTEIARDRHNALAITLAFERVTTASSRQAALARVVQGGNGKDVGTLNSIDEWLRWIELLKSDRATTRRVPHPAAGPEDLCLTPASVKRR